MFPLFHLLNKVIQKLRTTQGPTCTVTTGICLGWQLVRSAHMEALMQHYQPPGFSEEVSRLAAAPRRPSTNRMYDDSFLYYLFDTHSLGRLKLSKATGPA